ncbi:PQQ-binding-like beta-propeller repeat protein [Nocardioides marinquilinus]
MVPLHVRRATALLALLLVGTVLTACQQDDDPAPQSEPTPSETPTATPTPTPEPPAEPEPAALDPLTWRSEEHRGQPLELRRLDGDYVAVETQAIARLSPTGEFRWRWTPDGKDDVWPFFAGDDVAVAEQSLKPKADHEVVAVDLRTGDELWRAPSNGYSTGGDGRVFTTTCTGGRTDDSDGDCTMTARDARTGDPLWVDDFGTYTENTFLVGERDQRLLVQSFPDGSNSQQFLVDPATGATVDADVLEASKDYAIYPPLASERLEVVESRRTPRGCRSRISAFDLDGEPLWQATVAGRRTTKRPRACLEPLVLDTPRVDVVADSDTGLTALDARSGEVLWTSSDYTEIDQVADGAVLVRDGFEHSAALDLRTGELRWRIPHSVGGWDVDGRYIAGNTSECEVTCSIVVDARTGDVLLHLEGVSESYLPPRRPGGRTALLTRIDDDESYRAAYGFTVLPRLGDDAPAATR